MISNYPLGAENDKSAPFNRKEFNVPETCECGGKLEYFDSGYVKVNGRSIEWVNVKCVECDEIY